MEDTFRILSRGGPGLEEFLFQEYSKSRIQHEGLFDDRSQLKQMLSKELAFNLFTLEELIAKPFLMDAVFESNTSFVILKKSDSVDGEGIAAISLNDLNQESLCMLMEKDGYSYLELPITQSPFMSEIAPMGISTLNILSWKSELDEVRIFAAALQLTSSSPLDSMGAGGIWINLDPDLGVALNCGLQVVPSEKIILHHPLSGHSLSEIAIPDWSGISGFISGIYEKLELRGLLSFELVIQDEGPKLLGFPSLESLNQWFRFGEQEFFNDLKFKN